MTAAKKSILIDVFLLTVVLLIGFCTYGVPVLLNPDEGRYAEIAREFLATHSYIVPHINGVIYFEKPPLIYWLTSLAIKVFGYSEWSVRSPNVLLSVLGVYFSYFFCYKIFNRRVALLTGLMLASSLMYIAMGRLLTLDMGLSFFFNMSLLAFLCSQQYPQGRTRTGYLLLAYVCCGLAVMTKGFIGLVLPAFIIGCWILILNKWSVIKSMHLIIGIIIVLLISVPWILAVQHVYPYFIERYVMYEQILRYATNVKARGMDPFTYTGLVLLCVFPWTIFLPQSVWRLTKMAWRNRQAHANEMFCFIWGVSIILFFAFSNSVLPSYFVLYTLPLCIWIAIYVVEKIPHFYSKSTLAAIIVFVLVCLVLVGAILVIRFKPAIMDISEPFFTNTHLVLCALFLVCVLATLIFYLCKQYKLVFAAMILAITVFVNLGLLVSGFYNRTHLQLPIEKLQILLQHNPHAEVANYNMYLQSSPYYLKRTLIVVDWQGELDYGVSRDPSTLSWMLDHKEFWPRWNSHQLMFVLLHTDDYNALFKSKKHHGYLVTQTPDVALVANGEYK